MKIGIVIWKLDLNGGEQRQALELAKCLQEMGHEVEVYTGYFDKEKCYPELCARIKNIKFLENKSKKGDSIFSKILNHLAVFKKSRKLSELIDSNLDILNCHEYTTFPAGFFYKKRTNVPIVGMINDAPSFNGIFEFKESPLKFPPSFIKRKLYTPFLKVMDAIVVLDNINMNRLKKYYGLEARIIRSGLDLKKFPYKKRISQNPTIKLLAVGSFCHWRRYEDLIKALKIVKDKKIDFEFNHIGSEATDKGYARKIKNMAKDFELSDCVTFQGGQVSEEKLVEFYSTSDIFLFPNYPQTWGLVVFEALAAGIPAVISSRCGAAEVLENGENALLVPPKSPEKIAEVILKLKENPDLWRRLSENGRKFVEENIRWDLYAKQMLNLFQKTLNKSHEV